MAQGLTSRVLILLSGGLDSACLAATAVANGYSVTALSVLYGQRHEVESKRAAQIAFTLNILHIEACITGHVFGGALVGEGASVVVPGRNAGFLSLACSCAERLGIDVVQIGACAADFERFPDCRPDFIEAWNGVLNASGLTVRVQAPLVNVDKADIVRRLAEARPDVLPLTWSCYDPRFIKAHVREIGIPSPCGDCLACQVRAEGFAHAGIQDPLLS